MRELLKPEGYGLEGEEEAEDVRVEAEQIMRIKNTLVTMYATPTPLNRDP